MARIFTLGPEIMDLAGEKLSSGSFSVSNGRKTLKGSGGDPASYDTVANNTLAFTATSEIYFRGCFYNDIKDEYYIDGGDAYGQIRFRTGTTTHCRVCWGTAGSGYPGLMAGYSTSTSTVTRTAKFLERGVWYRIEVHVIIHDTNGLIEVKVDDELVLTYSGDTKNGSTATLNNVQVWTGDGSPLTGYMCDLAVNDTTGALNNSWCGEGYCTKLFPKGVGNTTGLTPTPAPPNWDCVNTLGDDTDYVDGSVSGLYDTYDMEDLPAEAAAINVALAYTRSQYATAMLSEGVVVRSGGADYNSGVIATTTSWVWYPSTAAVWWQYETDPATAAAWTVPNFNAAELGPRVV